MRRAIRIERVFRNRANAGPSVLPVQVLRRPATSCVKCQQSEPLELRLVLDVSHQQGCQPFALVLARNEQFGDLAAMGLVRRPGWLKLHRTGDLFPVTSNEEDCVWCA
jgi:hypothetical protein